MRAKRSSNRKSIRLKGFDYSKPGVYYITICTRNLEFLFGEISLGIMYPSDGGVIVIECWNSIPKHYPNVRLHSFILMPNHIHGILEILESEGELHRKGFEIINPTVEGLGRAQDVEPLPNPQLLGFRKIIPLKSINIKKNEFQHIIPQSLGSIIRGFEIGITKWFRQNTNVYDVWQRNFYDSIIQTEAGFARITKYIENNQKNWTRDKFYKNLDDQF